jgi:hypothetical protein
MQICYRHGSCVQEGAVLLCGIGATGPKLAQLGIPKRLAPYTARLTWTVQTDEPIRPAEIKVLAPASTAPPIVARHRGVFAFYFAQQALPFSN